MDLDPGSLSAGAKRPPEAVRVFGLDSRYLEEDSSIRIVNGSYEPGSGLLSAEAALALSVGPGAVVVRVPGRSQPIGVRISGITDVSQAKSLLQQAGKAARAVRYVSDRRARPVRQNDHPGLPERHDDPGTVLRHQPILEVDVFVEREPLDADPDTALAQTKAVADAVNAVAPGQDVLIDNISNALEVAGKTPGRPSACSSSSGFPVLCWRQFSPRTRAGAGQRAVGTGDPADPRRQPASPAPDACTAYLCLAGVGSVLGVALGLASSAAVLPADALASASAVSLLASALLGAAADSLPLVSRCTRRAGAPSTARSVTSVQLASHRPVWSLLGIDF